MMTGNKLKRSTKIAYVLKLSEISRDDIERVGAKAANLGDLVRAGFPVPDGFVLTTDAFSKFLAVNNINAEGPPEAVTAAVLPVDIADALLIAAGELGNKVLAVRSSGVAEDLPDASFAGQYETVLNVCGKDALLDAVRHCWSSAFNKRVLAYRKAHGQQVTPRMALLVQCMVSADAAGVAFTANPVTGEQDTAVVNAVRGLGERLVSGKASPDEWLVMQDQATCRSSPERAISADQARAVAKLARRVEAHYGSPQDIEWAYAGGNLFLLQARPITTLPDILPNSIAVPAKPPPGFWGRDYHITEPVMPIARSLHFEAFNDAWRQIADEAGMLINGIEYREIGGWIYIHTVPLGGKENPPPAWMLAILARVVPLIRSRVKKCIEGVRSDGAGQVIRLWYNEWKPSRIAHITKFQRVDLRSLSDSALYEHITSLASFFKESAGYHVRLAVVATPLAKLAFACRDMLGWDDTQTLELLSGLSERSSEPARKLNELASMAAERPALRSFLEKSKFANADCLDEVDPEFAAAFRTYKRDFGCRGLQYGFHEPTLAERPELILGLIRDQIARNFNIAAVAADLNDKRNAALQKARTALANHSAKDRERFEHALADAELAYPVREDNVFYNHNVPFGLMRYGLLELGRRFYERGQLSACDDIFFLEIDEALSALKNGEDLKELVTRRKAKYAWAKEHPGPATYGKAPGQPPSLAGFPAEVQFMQKAFMWYAERVFPGSLQGKRQPQGSSRLSGIAASAGRFTGPVRIIMDESEFDKIRAGDVLVCPVTSPTWSIIFPSVGALITDTGGILSHPAIIAREYRVPAVVATGNATKLLHDGQTVTVDGSAGMVEVNV